MQQNLLEEYTDFVDKVTSEASKSSDKMRERINYLNSKDIEVSRLLTAGIGLSGEVGEFNEIIKKIMFQEKTFDVVAHEHMRRELGDIMWYVAQACLALKVDLVDIIIGNKEKFYESIDKALTTYLKSKLNLDNSELNNKYIRSRLQQMKVEKNIIDLLFDVLENCQLARYTPLNIEAMSEDYENAKLFIEQLEKLKNEK